MNLTLDQIKADLRSFLPGGIADGKWSRTPANERELLMRCATPRAFDKALYAQVLRVKGAPAFTELIQRPEIEEVPFRHGFFRVGAGRRAALLQQWWTSLSDRGKIPPALEKLSGRLA